MAWVHRFKLACGRQPSISDGAILALADQPLVTAEIYNRLVAQREVTGKPIVTSETQAPWAFWCCSLRSIFRIC